MKLNDDLKKVETVQDKINEIAGEVTETVETIETNKNKVQAIKESKIKKNVTVEDDLDKLICTWKKQYGKVFKNFLDENTFVIWRPIKRKEYKAILQLEEEGLEVLNKQEAFVKAALLYPKDAEDLIESRAGLASVLSEEILKHSGFDISDSLEL